MASNADQVRMASEAYRKDKEERSAPPGWELYEVHADDDTSGLQGSIYFNHASREVVFAFAGTNDWPDIPADSNILVGGYHQQFRDAVTFVHTRLIEFAEKETFVDYTFSATGHSLGGAHAQVIAHTFKWDGRAFESPAASRITDSQDYQDHLAELGIVAKGVGDDFINYTESGSPVSADFPGAHHLGAEEELNLRSDAYYMLYAAKGIMEGAAAGLATGAITRNPAAGMAAASTAFGKALAFEVLNQHSLGNFVAHFAPDSSQSLYPALTTRLNGNADIRESYNRAIAEIGRMSTPDNSAVYDHEQYSSSRIAFNRALESYYGNHHREGIADNSPWNIPGLAEQNAPEIFTHLLHHEQLKNQPETGQAPDDLQGTPSDFYTALAMATGAHHAGGTYTGPDAGFDFDSISDPNQVVATGSNDWGEAFIVRASEVAYWQKTAKNNGINHLDDRAIAEALASGAADLNGPEAAYGLTGGVRRGTSFDSSAYGFDISTRFSHGNRDQETQTFGSDFQSILNDGQLISGGNWRVTSKTTNTPGFFVEANAAISDGHQPGRSNIIQTTASDQVSHLWNDRNADADGLSQLNDLRLSTSWLTDWSSDLAEIDPLVLDLDGDGVEMTSFADHYRLFDIDNDGHAERTGWVGADDGLLVHDRDGDGKINDVTETLSEYYGAKKGTGAVYGSSLEALKTLDSNRDGKIDRRDARFGELRVWQDANQNGETDRGELKSLTRAGITELSLEGRADGSFIGGNEIKFNTSYRKSDGSSHVMAAVNFIADPNGLTQETDGAGIRIEMEDGAATYSVGSARGEYVRASDKKVANIIGGKGNDILIGDSGNNWLVGSLGEDFLYGGPGHDYLVADAADIANARMSIWGGLGFDVVQFVGDRGVTFNLQRSQVEMAIGTDQADILASGSSDPSIINGGGGHDVILGGSASDVLNGEEGNDTVYGYQGNDLIRGHRGADNLIGGRGNDILQGGLDRDTLSGGTGEDLLDGGAGNDRLDGGRHYDVAQYSGSYGDYTVTANRDGTYTVVDRRDGSPDGTDTLKNIEALNFADINEVRINSRHPLPVRDVVRVNAEEDGRTYRIAISDLLANDLDYQGDRLSLRKVFDAMGGSVSIDGNEVVFVVDGSFKGIPSFSCRITDEHGNNGLPVRVTGTNLKAEMSARVALVLEDHPEDPQFPDQWYLPEINVLPVWNDYTGEGVRIGVFEPSPWDAEDHGQIDYSHPDLLPGIDAESLRTRNPNIEPTRHATLVSGVIGAARNDIGGVGVAYNVTLASEGVKESDLGPLQNWRNYDIANNSWGPENQFSGTVIDGKKNVLTHQLLETAVRFGRDGLGTITVLAGGNNRQKGHDTNGYDFTNNRYGITVGAINAEGDLGNLRIAQAPFSNPGASILVSAPGSNITSTSRIVENRNGSTFGNDYEATQGTSFAAPIVSGVVALMLEANPLLGWRDVQEILALSAKHVDDPNTSWRINGAVNWNGGGMHYSHDYGFGLVDALAAVRLAETWQKKSVWNNEAEHFYQSGDLNRTIYDGSRGTSHTISVKDKIRVENVSVQLDLQHTQLGDVEIVLRSPDGTESILINRPGIAPDGESSDRGHGSFDKVWLTATTHHWGEDSIGNWTLIVRDRVTGETGILHDWKLGLYGEKDSENDTYVYTDEFARFGNGSRAVLSDSSGHDILNTSAVTGDVTIDLSGRQASSIAGRSLTFSKGTIIETVHAGDGNDTIYGNKAVNHLHGGRGADKLHATVNDSGSVSGNFIYLQGDKTVRHLTKGKDIISINNADNFHVADTSVSLRSGNGGLIASGSNHYTSFDLSEDKIDLRSINGLNGFDDLEIRNRITISNLTWAGISTAKGGMILLAGINAPDLNASHFIFASQGDVLFGEQGNDILYGSDGNDSLHGGDGDDNLYGGKGNDIFHHSAGDDNFHGGAGEDIVRYDRSLDQFTIANTENGLTVTNNSTQDIHTFVGMEKFHFGTITYTYKQLSNVAPVAGNVDLGSILEDQSTIFNVSSLLVNSTDANGDKLSITNVRVDSRYGQLSYQGEGNYRFTPTQDFHGGNVGISFTVSDGSLTADATATLDILPVNDAPIIVNPIADQSANEGETWNYTLPENIFKDVDDDTLTLSASLADGSALPSWLTFKADSGVLSGTPPRDFEGTLQLRITASDSQAETPVNFDLTIGTPETGRNTDIAADTSTAGRIKVGSEVIGVLEEKGDRDWYAITLKADREYEISLSGHGGNNVRDTYLRLYNASGLQIKYNDDGGQGRYSKLVYSPGSDGTFYISADSYNSRYTGDYKISVIEKKTSAPVAPPTPGLTIDGISGNDNSQMSSDDDLPVEEFDDDELSSPFGDNTYYYSSGDGNYIINDSFGNNRLILSDINVPDIASVSRTNRHDAVLEIASTGETITLRDQFWFIGCVSSIEFADGSTWTNADLNERAWVRGTDGNDHLHGAFGGSRVAGGAGDDSMMGSRGDDVLDGGTGNDTLRGSFGDDTFIFAQGYGQDVIIDFTAGASNFYTGDDVIEFRDLGVSTFDEVMLRAYQDGSDTVFDFGNGDQLTLNRVNLSHLTPDDLFFS